MSDTIFALATAPGQAAIAVVRISGPAVHDICQLMIGAQLNDKRATLVNLRIPGSAELLDQAVAILSRAPKSYTGESCLELQIHGGSAVTSAVLRSLASIEGCRLAVAGEFSRRALLNGKMDLASLEGLGDLIRARTEEQRKQGIAVASGFLTRRIEAWRDNLLSALALIESGIDFADEGDVDADILPKVRLIVRHQIADLAAALKDSRRGEIIREGFVVTILGLPNVGKSSFLNFIAQREAAIVTEFPGTTRDPIEVRIEYGGLEIVFVDTAGIRETLDPLEAEGIRRTMKSAAQANVLLILDDGQGLPSVDVPSVDQTRILVRSKADGQNEQVGQFPFAISSKTGFGIDRLLEEIGRLAAKASFGSEPAIITRQRHMLAIEEASNALGRVESLTAFEFIAEELRLALRGLESIVGLVGPEDVLGDIFSRFCIGK